MYDMHADSETEFLNTILSSRGYNPREQNCAEILESLCLGEKRQIFLEICYELFKLIIPSLLKPARDLPDGILNTIVSDLNQIIVPLWRTQAYSELVNDIMDAQNMASNANGEKNKRTRGNYVKDCFKAVDRAYKDLDDILDKLKNGT